MSTTLSMTAMVALLQRKTGLGLQTQDCVDRLNEAFRSINQRSKGGFVWQLKNTALTFLSNTTTTAAPSDFDAGKTALLRGDGAIVPVTTTIPYQPMKDFVNQVHFQTTSPGFFAAWTCYPNFVLPTSYAWTIALGPASALIAQPITLPFTYHAVNFAPVANGAGNYFPTPDQFDSLIVDLAVAEIQDIYRLSDGTKTRERAYQAINEIIDTYRTDRYDLAGVTDNIAQAQEKQAEGAR